ncbi:MAG: Mur ligase family protein [Eubacterium sp.]|nr:Mur ligase family protein [Eubacterium sp.]
MIYEEARKYMAGKPGEIHLSLDRIRVLLERLGSPEKKLRFIHIAGTNGKGSTANFLYAAFVEAGYNPGLFTSPVVFEYGEQFRCMKGLITTEEYCEIADRLKAETDRMEQSGIPCPSSFELETCMAFLYFLHEHCDPVILECGMGGENDATNVIPAPVLAVFTPISLDHSAWLGSTIEEIAGVKAGIIKKGCRVISGCQEDGVLEVLEQKASAVGAAFVRTGYCEPGNSCIYRGLTLKPGIPGICQIQNAAAAADALLEWGACIAPIPRQAIESGIAKASLPGRFMKAAEDPDFIVDGAHNPGAAKRLREYIEALPSITGKTYNRTILVAGIFKDKDYRSVFSTVLPLADEVITVATPGNERALPAEEAAAEAARFVKSVRACRSVEEAVDSAYSMADPGDLIISFGSLSNIKAIIDRVKLHSESRQK